MPFPWGAVLTKEIPCFSSALLQVNTFHVLPILEKSVLVACFVEKSQPVPCKIPDGNHLYGFKPYE